MSHSVRPELAHEPAEGRGNNRGYHESACPSKSALGHARERCVSVARSRLLQGAQGVDVARDEGKDRDTRTAHDKASKEGELEKRGRKCF